jgi:hypothetical protein
LGYYIRAFCTVNEVPQLNSILRTVNSSGKQLQLSPEIEEDPNSSTWEQAAIIYKTGKLPFLVECNRDAGTSDCLLREEIKEFLDCIGKPGLSLAKRNVIASLNKTRYIITCQIPTSDMDDEGYNACNRFLEYFEKYCGGMVQADGEGFYKGSKLLIKIE